MRLPYLQVTQETWTNARVLARLLGTTRREAFAIVCDLWVWAFELGPDDRAPDGCCIDPDAAEMLAGALEWDGDAEKLLSAMLKIGLVEKLEIGLRVRGMDRYKRTWEKNRRTPTKPPPLETLVPAQPAPVLAGKVPVSGANPAQPAPVPARQTQTQTQIEEETLSANLPTGEESEKPDSPARQVFDHWRAAMGKTAAAKMDSKRAGAVRARLHDGYTVDDLKRAVDGCKATPHNMGQNDRGEKYDDLGLICRDAAHVDRFMANAGSPPVGSDPPKPKWKPNPTPAGFWDAKPKETA